MLIKESVHTSATVAVQYHDAQFVVNHRQ
jgi:hypothetical protein